MGYLGLPAFGVLVDIIVLVGYWCLNSLCLGLSGLFCFESLLDGDLLLGLSYFVVLHLMFWLGALVVSFVGSYFVFLGRIMVLGLRVVSGAIVFGVLVWGVNWCMLG